MKRCTFQQFCEYIDNDRKKIINWDGLKDMNTENIGDTVQSLPQTFP